MTRQQRRRGRKRREMRSKKERPPSDSTIRAAQMALNSASASSPSCLFCWQALSRSVATCCSQLSERERSTAKVYESREKEVEQEKKRETYSNFEI